jgi:hypothetical protein
MSTEPASAPAIPPRAARRHRAQAAARAAPPSTPRVLAHQRRRKLDLVQLKIEVPA